MSSNLADVSLANHKWKAKPAPKTTAKAGATQNPAAVETKKGKKQANKTTVKSTYSPAPKVKKTGKANKKTKTTPLLNPSTAAPESFTGEWKTEPGASCYTTCSIAGLECNQDSLTKMDSVSFCLFMLNYFICSFRNVVCLFRLRSTVNN